MNRQVFTALTATVLIIVGCRSVETEQHSTTGVGGGLQTQPSCPKVTGRSAMVAVPDTFGGSFCMDSFEATNDEYVAFLASGAHPDLHTRCESTTDFVPKSNWPPSEGRGTYPVVDITWCDAQAFCVASGKRLCGELGTGLVRDLESGSQDDYDKGTEMWAACTKGGQQTFVYGDAYQPTTCNDSTGYALMPADSRPSCEGAYPGIYNLQGNAWEWEGQCNLKSDQASFPVCLARKFGGLQGGCIATAGSDAIDHEFPVTAFSDMTGVRCCADLSSPMSATGG